MANPSSSKVMASFQRGLLLPGLLALILVALCGGCGPRDPVQEVRELQEQGRFADSLDPLRALLEERPDDPELHFLYGSALRRTGQASLSLWSLRKASRQPGWEVPAGLELAASAYQSQNFPTAVKEAGRVLEIEPDNTQALRLRAEAQLADRTDLDRALADFDSLLKDDPDNVDLRVSRATALLMMKRVDEAEAALDELEQLAATSHLGDETRAAYCVARGTFAKEKGDMAKAEEQYGACLDEFPTDETVAKEAIVFFDGTGRPERSTELLRNLVEKKPDAVELRDVLARRLVAAGDVAGAEAVLRAGTELEPPALAAFAWRALADHFIAQGENDKAVAALKRAIDLDEDPSQQLLLAYADLLVAAGQYDRALTVAKDLEQESFRDLVEARVLFERHQPQQAIERFEAALRTWPDNAAARYYTARAAEQLGDFDRAIEEYRESIRAGAQYTDAGLRLAQLYEAQGSYRLALGAASHHAQAHGESADTRLYELRLRTRTGEARRAREILKQLRHPATWPRALAFVSDTAAERQGPEAGVKVVRGDKNIDLTRPADVDALRALVRHLLDAGRFDEALAAADAAIAAHDEVAAFHQLRGQVLERRGDAADEARAAYERAVALDPDAAGALAGLASLAAAQGDVDAAVALYERASAADPSDPAPARAAAELLAGAGRSEQAEHELDALLWQHPYDAPAARRLAELLSADGKAGPRTEELLRRAKRFGGGAEASAQGEGSSPSAGG